MSNEYVSIILPTYNRAHCIKESIDSILNQSYPYFELIIIDDCSTDNTTALISDIKDERISYYVNEQNHGPSYSRNRGIELAKYDYVAFQDSDDLWLPDKLEKQMEMITGNTSLGMVYTMMECRDEDGTVSYTPDKNRSIESLQENLFHNILSVNVIGLPTALIRKDVFSNVGLFNEDFHALEDWELFIRIAGKYSVGYVNEPLFIYNRSNSGNVSSNLDAYFEARCKLIKLNKTEMINENVLSAVMEDILAKGIMYGQAEKVGGMILESIV